ncbi:MAG: alanine racemase [Coriobacteriia bacterium]|nr:alanine racemase [Coriobacteriia bacterium]MCL2536740.1 alanine racemase [Coriobacteriia bacterium]
MTKHRQAWLDIDLAAIRDNVAAFRSFLAAENRRAAAATKRVIKTPAIMAVVKADAYGHGAAAIAQAATNAGASWLGVATVDEALSLRGAGITANILLLSEPPEEALPELLEAAITCTVASTDFLQTLAGYALLEHREISYHLKVDTGMRRIGIAASDAVATIRDASQYPLLKMGGIFTHFANADVARDWDTQQQLETFAGIIRRLDDLGLRPPLVHACNSAATLLLPAAHYDMVRIGICLYGQHPSADTQNLIELTPAMSVRAQASLVKPIAMGEGVGYGLSWQAHKPMKLVTLPLGYADGIPRLCSNKMSILIDKSGTRIEQVGRVCMDMLMAAAESGEALEAGDEFVLMGAPRRLSEASQVRELVKKARTQRYGKPQNYISADELAHHAQTISYEILCGLGNRLEKVYRNA